MIKVEVCINSDASPDVKPAVEAAYLGGASTIELCAAMHLQGLTPTPEQIVAARQAFSTRNGLMVMIRPRGGDFSYSEPELETMRRQIQIAAEKGADGVVLGVLHAKDNRLDVAVTRQLIQTSRDLGLKVTFHRAFDATPQPLETLDELIELGAQRVLTCGLPWGQPGNAGDGVATLSRIITQARGRIEVVIGGGVNPLNVGGILKQLPLELGTVSVHAYSGAQENGVTTIAAVKTLLRAANFM